MSARLFHYLLDAYETRGNISPRAQRKYTPIQIDDQDDNDNLNEFCNLFVMVKKRNQLEVELTGNFPITDEIADLAEIYEGYADRRKGRVVFCIYPVQIGAITDLAVSIRKTAFMGKAISNPSWHRVSARTISSLHRFVRIIREYQRLKGAII